MKIMVYSVKNLLGLSNLSIQKFISSLNKKIKIRKGGFKMIFLLSESKATYFDYFKKVCTYTIKI